MKIAIDIIIIILIVLPAVNGFRKGLFKSVFNAVAIVLSAAAAFILKGAVGEFIRDKIVLGIISKNVQAKLSSLIESGNTDINSLIHGNNADYNKLLDGYFASKNDVSSYVEKAGRAGGDALKSAADRISYTVADKISLMIAFILVFIAVLLVLKLIIRFVSNVGKQTVFSGINRFAGALLGFALGAVLAILFVYLLNLLIPVLSISLPALFYRNILNDTVIGSFINNLNIISLFNRF